MSETMRPRRRPWRDRNGDVSTLKALTFVVMFYPAAWCLYHLAVGGFGPLPLVGLIYWSGIWATGLLLAALAVTPISRIFTWRRLVVVRRMIGVAALAYTAGHVVIYTVLYKMDLEFLARDVLSRPTLVVASLSTLGLLVLGATSFDGAVRRMGGARWKRMHRTNYVLTGLAILHFLLSPGIFSMQYVFVGVFIWLMAWRWLDRRSRGTDPVVLVLLALTVSLGTMLIEAGWLWAFHGADPVETLSDNLTLILGVTAGWWVLALGLTVALGPRLVRAATLSIAPPLS